MTTAFGAPVSAYDDDDLFYVRVGEIEVACNVPVNFESRLEPILQPDESRQPYPKVDVGDCSVEHLRQAFQASLDTSPCAYRVEAGLGGLVVAPTQLTGSGCELAPSRMDERVVSTSGTVPMWQQMNDRGLNVVNMMMAPRFVVPEGESVSMREVLLRLMPRHVEAPRKAVYRVTHVEPGLLGQVTFAGTSVRRTEPSTGPYDARKEWWIGDSGPRYRRPTFEESQALDERRDAWEAGELSDEQWATHRGDEMLGRLLNPRPDGKDWGDLRLIYNKGAYDANGCLSGSKCELRHSKDP